MMRRPDAVWSRALAASWGLLVVFGCTLSDKLRNDPVFSARSNGGAVSQSRAVSVVTDRTIGSPQQLGFDNHWSETISCANSTVTVPAPTAPAGSAAEVQATLPVLDSCAQKTPFEGFVQAIEGESRARKCDRVLIYVHGYNTTFRSALLRAGQIAADAEWPCAVSAFSWGSEGQFDRYAADIERSGYATPLLMDVLVSLNNDKALKTNIIAHSMGARLTLAAIAGLNKMCVGEVRLVDELIVAAPDVSSEEDNDDFGTLLKRALPCIRRVTVYASRNDMVLMLSQSIHGGIPRAGLEPEADMSYTASPGNVEVVDASNAPGDPFGHGYFVSSYEMLNDMKAVLQGVEIASRASGPSPTLRCLSATCGGPQDRYQLVVAPERRPDWPTRFTRHVLAHLLAIRYGVPGQFTP